MFLYVTCDVTAGTAAQRSDEGSNIDVKNASLIEGIVRKYNDALVFGASEGRMAYTIRDPLTSGVLLCVFFVACVS